MDIKEEPADYNSDTEMQHSHAYQFYNSQCQPDRTKFAGVSVKNSSPKQNGRADRNQPYEEGGGAPAVACIKSELEEWQRYKEKFYDNENLDSGEYDDADLDDDDYDEADVIDEDALEESLADGGENPDAHIPSLNEISTVESELTIKKISIGKDRTTRATPPGLTIKEEVINSLMSEFCETQFEPASCESLLTGTPEKRKFNRYIDAISEANSLAMADSAAKKAAEAKAKALLDAEKIFVCDICNFKCRYSSNLKTHKRIHDNFKPFKCDVCSFECRHSSYLKTHKLIHINLKPYTCDECKFSCRSSGHLKKHKMIHYEEKPFTCDICGLKFRQSSHLKRHKIIHVDAKPFACDLCDYRCKRMSHLQIHKIKHNDIKPYTCRTCQIKFKRSGELKRHEMIHNNVKPFSCDVCAFKCRTSTNLKKHRMIHTDVKPFACEICHFKCRQLGNLKKHQLIHRSKGVVVEITYEKEATDAAG